MPTRTADKQTMQRMREVQPTVACPRCNGVGIIDGANCCVCGGDGSVDEITDRWITIGSMCRAARLSISATLADAAFYLGGDRTMADIARMEAGMTNPAPLYRHWFKGVA